MSMHGVDDAEFVDDTFWTGLGDAPSLRDVCERLASWLRGEHVSRIQNSETKSGGSSGR